MKPRKRAPKSQDRQGTRTDDRERAAFAPRADRERSNQGGSMNDLSGNIRASVISFRGECVVWPALAENILERPGGCALNIPFRVKTDEESFLHPSVSRRRALLLEKGEEVRQAELEQAGYTLAASWAIAVAERRLACGSESERSTFRVRLEEEIAEHFRE